MTFQEKWFQCLLLWFQRFTCVLHIWQDVDHVSNQMAHCLRQQGLQPGQASSGDNDMCTESRVKNCKNTCTLSASQERMERYPGSSGIIV